MGTQSAYLSQPPRLLSWQLLISVQTVPSPPHPSLHVHDMLPGPTYTHSAWSEAVKSGAVRGGRTGLTVEIYTINNQTEHFNETSVLMATQTCKGKGVSIPTFGSQPPLMGFKQRLTGAQECPSPSKPCWHTHLKQKSHPRAWIDLGSEVPGLIIGSRIWLRKLLS